MLSSYTDAVSNRADWIDVIEVTDADTGEAINLDGAEILIEVRRFPESCSPILSASTSDGNVSVLEVGRAQFHFARSEMIAVPAGVYAIGITVARDGITEQLEISTVSIVDGIVRK